MKKSKSETVLQFSMKYKKHLRYFPSLPANNDVISKRQQIYFFENAMPNIWQEKYDSNGKVSGELNNAVSYFQRLETAEKKRTNIGTEKKMSKFEH